MLLMQRRALHAVSTKNMHNSVNAKQAEGKRAGGCPPVPAKLAVPPLDIDQPASWPCAPYEQHTKGVRKGGSLVAFGVL